MHQSKNRIHPSHRLWTSRDNAWRLCGMDPRAGVGPGLFLFAVSCWRLGVGKNAR